MTKTIDHSPIAIPAGSYDAKELQALTDKAAKAGEEERAKILNEELPELGRATKDAIDNRDQPGYKFQTVKNEIAPGVFVNERISVFVGDKEGGDADKGKAAGAATSAPASTSEGKD